MQMATKFGEVVGTLKIRLPAAEPGVVAKIVIACQPLREFIVAAVIDPRVRHNRTAVGPQRRLLRSGGLGMKPLGLGQSAGSGAATSWDGFPWPSCAAIRSPFATGS